MVNAAVAETVDGGRTVEAYRLGPERVRLTDARIARWVSWERYTLWLRCHYFPAIEISYFLPDRRGAVPGRQSSTPTGR